MRRFQGRRSRREGRAIGTEKHANVLATWGVSGVSASHTIQEQVTGRPRKAIERVRMNAGTSIDLGMPAVRPRTGGQLMTPRLTA